MNSYLPFSLFEDFQRDFGRYAGNRSEVPTSGQNRRWLPSVDIVENDDGYLLTMDVPGVSSDSIEVTVHGGVLAVSGERKNDYADRKLAIAERWQGQFMRRFSLPESVDQDQIAAKVENGVLALHIPKQADEAPRKITVQ